MIWNATVLGLDQGTTSSRAIVFDRRANVKAVAQREFRQIYPQPGWVEHDPSQRTTPALTDGFEVETVEYGKRRVRFEELAGNDVRLTFFLNDAPVSQQTLSNPSLTTIYTTVAAGLFPGAAVSADGKTMTVDQHLHISFHVVQRNPLDLRLLVSNEPPLANWWQ